MYKGPYKNLKIWQKSIRLVKRIYVLTQKFPKEELYSLTSQLRRAAISIPSNIAEGSRRSSNKEFANFILIARGFLAEIETQMILASEFKYFTKGCLQDFLDLIDELDKMLFSFHKTLQTPNSKLPTRIWQ